ncbi:MAG TPA: condensation domain-containing protein, partial [Blastocatellia bacterium]|nr:condensation domain-containing protein [Blastocatellia bacterium]
MRGYRIEPGEIEEVLKEHPQVKNAAVAVSGGAGGARLVGYVEWRGGEAWRAGEVRDYLKARLPEYMVPGVVMRVEEMPVTRNGKVDRAALPPPDDFTAEGGREAIAAQTPTEELLAGIWMDVFGLSRVGPDNNFFELGGHSLLASQLIARVRETLRVELSIGDLFKRPTLAELADYISGGGGRAARHELSPIQPTARGDFIPPSFAQERVWFLSQLAPDSIAYNAQVTIRFKGPLNVGVLEQVFVEVIRRHEIFRTSFSDIGGRLAQVIHPPPSINLPVFDLSEIDEGRREHEAERLVSEELRRPFDVEKIPLVRWTVLRMKPDEHVLIQVEHHFVHDGWSFAVLLREVKALYQAFVKGEPSPLAPLPLQYADFAIWQRDRLQGEVLDAELAFWKEALAGVLPLNNLPTDYPRPKVQSFRGAAQRIELPPDLSDALRSLSRSEGCTLFMTMYATFLVLLHRYTGQSDLILGSGVANRRLHEIEGLIGMIVNTVPMRADLKGEPTFREALWRVREAALAAYAHQDVPFEKIVEALHLERDISHNPLFQMMFSFHDSPVPELEFGGLTGSILERHNGSAKFDISLIVIPRAEQRVGKQASADNRKISILWEYSTDLFEEGTIRRMIGHYLRLLHSAVGAPAAAIGDLPLLSVSELDQLLLDFNRTSADFPDGLFVTQMFEQVAARQPHSVALSCEQSFVSYDELDFRSSQLAAYLQAAGVTAETLVAVAMDRSIDLIVSLLAVVKAGGAYLPIDVSYPAHRIAYMLEDSQAKIVLTHSRVGHHLPRHPGAARAVFVDQSWDEIAACGVLARPVNVAEQRLCYVIYTSGSTGKPKGVAVTHGGLANIVMWHHSQLAGGG